MMPPGETQRTPTRRYTPMVRPIRRRASAASLAEWVVVPWTPAFLPLCGVKKPGTPRVMERKGKGEEHRVF